MTSSIRLGDLEVRRLGYGAMRLPGKDVWGEPDRPEDARRVVRRAVELGVNFIDSAWYYGPHVAHRLIAEALRPYPAELVIATKLGARRLPDKGWAPAARPDELREGAEHDLKTLKRDRLDVVHLRFMPNSGVPLLESLDALVALQREGKIRHLALSAVDAAQVRQVLARTPIVAVQNLFGVANAGDETQAAVLAECEARGLAFLPFFPLAMGKVAQKKPALAAVAQRHGASEAQIALAWLLARSPVMLPIPGTASVAHLEENWAAQTIRLTREDLAALA